MEKRIQLRSKKWRCITHCQSSNQNINVGDNLTSLVHPFFMVLPNRSRALHLVTTELTLQYMLKVNFSLLTTKSYVVRKYKGVKCNLSILILKLLPNSHVAGISPVTPR